MAELTQAYIREIFNYDPLTGHFTRTTGPRRGSIAGYLDPSRGYVRIRVDKQFHAAHRLAWLYMTGAWPKDQIDHINLDKSDNRLENLREASHTQNQQNRRPQRNNTSGFKGVRWHQKTWNAEIHLNKRTIHIGCFDSPEAAHAAYQAAATQLFGAYARFD